jgi:undecaprenyl phosphate-alpha-L-ara4FN deformylase
MKRIALKIDVDTCRGTLLGVPALIDLLQRHEASGSFFFSLGPDHSGREARAFSPSRHYDFVTRLYGMLLPAPDIGARHADNMRQARDAGFEVAIHAWNRVRWESAVLTAENAWIEAEMAQAYRRFEDIFGEPPQAHAAPGWRMNRHALRLTQRLGFGYASDCRGKSPFIPVIDGEIVLCPQLPTTLPTLDELLATGAASVDQAVERLVEESTADRWRPRLHACALNSRDVVRLHVRTPARRVENAAAISWSPCATCWLAQHRRPCRGMTSSSPRSRVAPAHAWCRERRISCRPNEKGRPQAALAVQLRHESQSRSPLKAISRFSRLTKTL